MNRLKSVILSLLRPSHLSLRLACRQAGGTKQSNDTDADSKLFAIQRSTRTTIKYFIPLHNALRMKWKWYYNWHLKPYANKLHISGATLTSITAVVLIIAVMFSTLVPQTKASNYSKTWSTTDDFNTGTNSNIDTSGDEAKLASTTTDFNEGFTSTTNKDAASDANWDTALHKLNLPGDPTSGVATDLQAKWKETVGINDNIVGSATDTSNHLIYFITSKRGLGAYNTANNTLLDLTGKFPSAWQYGYPLYSIAFDPINKIIYVGGQYHYFGAFIVGDDPSNGNFILLENQLGAAINNDTYTDIKKLCVDPVNGIVYIGDGSNKGYLVSFSGGSDPVNGTFVNLTSKISADWGSSSISAMSFDSLNGTMYFGGASGRFGVFSGGSDPANGTWIYLNSKISGDWSTTINSISYDSTHGKIYLAGSSASFGVFSGGSDPANGTWIYLNSKISGDWNTDSVLTSVYNIDDDKIYISGTYGKFGVFSGGSDPANGTWDYITPHISADWGSTTYDRINLLNISDGHIFLLSNYVKFGKYNLGSETISIITNNILPVMVGHSINTFAYDSANGVLYMGSRGEKRCMAYKLSDGSARDLSPLISGNYVYSLAYDSTNGKIYLGNNGAFGVFNASVNLQDITWTNLTSKVSPSISTIFDLVFDSFNGAIYLVGNNGMVGSFVGGTTPQNGTYNSLTTKISSDWSTSTINSLSYDSNNHTVYIAGDSGKFGSLKNIDLNPINDTWSYLSTLISSDWSTNAVKDLIYDSAGNNIYLGGNNGKFGAFHGGSNPGSGTWYYLSSLISAEWSSSTITALEYGGGKVFLGGQDNKFGIFTTQADPLNGSWNYLYSNISSYIFTGNGSQISSLCFISSAATVYIGAGMGQSYLSYGFLSFQQGYISNKSGISTAVDSTAQKIYKATLSATASTPDGTSITYYLSNDGGAHWYQVTSGSEYTFSVSASDLRWKAYLTTSNAAVTPEITGVAISYKYFNSDTGTMSLVYDAEQTVVPVWLSWTSATPANTALTFKIRTASTQAGLTSASWSDIKNASDTPVNLKTLNVGGTAGVPENRWSEVYASFSTTDGLNTPVLSDVTEQYVINAVPEIESVSAHQRTDGSKIIDVSYSIKDSDAHTNPYNQDQVSVSLQYSIDSGSNWSNCTTTTGTGLKNVNEGSFTSYASSWDIATDLANSYYDNTTLIKLIVNDNEQAHNLATLTTSPFSIDSKDPATPVFTISGGANASGKVNLTGIGATDDTTLTQMIVTLDPSYPESVWQAYSGALSDFPAESGDTIYVKVKDSFGNVSTGVSHKVPLTVQNVVLSDLSNASSSNYRLVVGWDAISSEDATGYKIYRKVDNGNFELLQSVNDLTTTGVLDSLVSQNHTYSYQVFATDSNSNIGIASVTVSGQPAFVPTVSNVDIGTILADKATVNWTTDVPCDSFVEFGADTSYGAIQGSSSLATSHSFTVTGLNSETTFHFRVRSRDQKGTLAMSNDDTFTTAIDTSGKNDDLSKKPSKISNVSATDTNFSSTVILWQTSVVSLSELEYGLTTDYGQSIKDSSANFTTQHTVKVTALESGLGYHFRIKGTDLFGNQFVSDDYFFSTLSMPTVNSVTVKEINSTGATITWVTNVETDSNVDFGQSDLASSQGSSEAIKDHSVRLINLKPATSYKFRVRSRDAFGNLATGAESEFHTIIDATAPVIRDMKSEVSILTDETGGSKAQAIVSWSTDEPATSQVHYALGVAAGSDYPLSTTEDTNLTTSHIVIISNLQPSSTYHMMLVSRDSSGNIGNSDDYTVLTLNQDKSLLQYIVQILEERFSWLKGFGLF